MTQTHLDGANEPPPPGVPGGGVLAPVNQRLVTWDADGNPLVKNVRVFTKTQVAEIAMAAASQPYVDLNDELAVALGLPPSRFYGMTNLEVMLVRQAEWAAASGETDVIEKVLDRLVGKPKQSSESLHIHDSYEEALKRIGAKAAATTKPAIQEAEIVDPLENL